MPFKTREEHNSYFRRYLNAQRISKRLWAKEYKTKQGCARCPERDPVCLDFHHLDGEKKDHSLAKMIGSGGFSQKAVEKEVKKCIVLCSNCHRKEHGYKNNGEMAESGNAVDC